MRFKSDESGQDLLEYALITIAVGLIFLTSMGIFTDKLFLWLGNALSNAL